MKPSNTPLQWFLLAVALLCMALEAVSTAFPEPDPTWTVQCPNYAGKCGDTTAVTFGYLR